MTPRRTVFVLAGAAAVVAGLSAATLTDQSEATHTASAQHEDEPSAPAPAPAPSKAVEVVQLQNGPADWQLASLPTPPDTNVSLLITERACASGNSAEGRVQQPKVTYTPEAIHIAIRVRPLGGYQKCPGNPLTPLVIALNEPVGDRVIFDDTTPRL